MSEIRKEWEFEIERPLYGKRSQERKEEERRHSTSL